MKKALETLKKELYFYKDHEEVIITQEDVNDRRYKEVNISGNIDNIWGDVDNIRGDVNNISGDVSGIRGNVDNISGDLSGIKGDISDCEITEEERKKGINIKDLIKIK